MFDWLRDRRRRKILEAAFPPGWDTIMEANVAHLARLTDAERARLRDLVQVFVEEKHWEALGGLELTDEIRVTIAAQACILILGRDHELYRRVQSILVYPSVVVSPSRPRSFFDLSGDLADPGTPISGEAMPRGPVVLVWDDVLRGASDDRDGHNVAYHEFAHKLDMLGGAADGVPPQEDWEHYHHWIDVFERAYARLEADARDGRRTLLDRYALKNAAEFFAVATENFFERPEPLARRHPDVYQVMVDFYRQDPAAAG